MPGARRPPVGGASWGAPGGSRERGSWDAGRPGGRPPDRGAVVPQWLPTLPTIGGAAVAVVLAFIIGRVTSGGGDSGTQHEKRAVVVDTTTTVALTPSTHVVARGETLAAIASRNGLTVNELAIANNIGDLNHVIVGQVLTIPLPNTVITTTTSTKAARKSKH